MGTLKPRVHTCSGAHTGGQAVLQLLFVGGFTFLVVVFLFFLI